MRTCLEIGGAEFLAKVQMRETKAHKGTFVFSNKKWQVNNIKSLSDLNRTGRQKEQCVKCLPGRQLEKGLVTP